MKDTLGRENRKHSDKICAVCKKKFRPRHEASKFCSRPCMWSQNKGRPAKPEIWWKNKKGYIEGRIRLPDGSTLRVKRHRFIAEGVLGRPLKLWEDVHHKDGVKDNNAPENLQVITHGAHTTLSNLQREYSKGYKMKLTEAERNARSLRAIAIQLDKMGRAAIAKALNQKGKV